MTYIVSSGTLNPTIPYHTIPYDKFSTPITRNKFVTMTSEKLRCLLMTTDVWCGLEQRAVDDAIDQWRRSLLACVDAEGGHNLGL